MNSEQRAEWLNSIWPNKLVQNHEAIRECFKTEVKEYRESQDPEHVIENKYQAALYLYILGKPEDGVLVFDAKMSDFDLGCGFDCEFMLGAGLEKTIEHAKEIKHQEMLEYLEELKGNSELSEIDEWLKYRIGYFGLST
jgi:hypothetical protein